MKRLPVGGFRSRPIASRLVAVIAAGLLAIALTPAAAGISLVAEVSEGALEDVETDSPPGSLSSRARSVEEIQFHEQNWDVGVRKVPGAPTASALARDEFSIMEQYPGAYTKPGALNSRLGESSNDFRFIEENQFLPESDAATADSLRGSVENDQKNVRRPRGAGEGWLGGGSVADGQAQAPSVELDRPDRIAGLKAAQWHSGDYRDLELNAVSSSTRPGSASLNDGGEITEQNQRAFSLSRDAVTEPAEDFGDYRFIEENTTGLPGSSLEPHATWEDIKFAEDNNVDLSGSTAHSGGSNVPDRDHGLQR